MADGNEAGLLSSGEVQSLRTMNGVQGAVSSLISH